MNIIVIVIILSLINIIYCNNIVFNNNNLDQCLSETSPCDLSTEAFWLNNVLPSNKDDILIDLSSINNIESDVYLLFPSQFSLEFNSINVLGLSDNTSTDIKTHLVFNQAAFNIDSYFNVTLVDLQIKYTSNINIIDSTKTTTTTLLTPTIVIESFNLINSNLTINGNSIIQLNNVYMVSNLYRFNVLDQTSLIVNGNAVFNAILSFISTGSLYLNGISTLKSIFVTRDLYIGQSATIYGVSQINTIYLLSESSQLVFSSENSLASVSNFVSVPYGSSISVIDEASLTFLGYSFNGSTIIDGDTLILGNNSLLAINCGFSFTEFNTQTNAKITIIGTSSSTIVQNSNVPNFNISYQFGLYIVSSNVGFVNSNQIMSNLFIKDSVEIYSLNTAGALTIGYGQNLVLSTKYTHNVRDIELYGSLGVYSQLNGTIINIQTSGQLLIFSEIYSPINNLGKIEIDSSTSLYSIQLQNKLIITQENIYIYQLEIEKGSSIYFPVLKLNDVNDPPPLSVEILSIIYPSFNIPLDIDSSISSSGNNSEHLVKEGDKVYLFRCDNYNQDLSKLDISNVTVTDINQNKIMNSFSFGYDSKTSLIFLTFGKYLPNPTSNPHSNPSSSFAKWKIALIISLIAGAALILVVIIVFKRRKSHHHEYKSLINH